MSFQDSFTQERLGRGLPADTGQGMCNLPAAKITAPLEQGEYFFLCGGLSIGLRIEKVVVGISLLAEAGRNHQGEAVDQRRVIGIGKPLCQVELRSRQNWIRVNQLVKGSSVGDRWCLRHTDYNTLDAAVAKRCGHEVAERDTVYQVGGYVVIKCTLDRREIYRNLDVHRVCHSGAASVFDC